MAITGRGLMALAGLFVFLAAFVGASQLKPTARLPEVLAGRSALVSDYDWFAANIGHAVPMEIVLTIPNERTRVADEDPEAPSRA